MVREEQLVQGTDGFFRRPDVDHDKYAGEKTWVRLAKLIKPGDVVLDGGAYIGIFSELAHRAGARKVLAFEPYRPSFELIAQNSPTAIRVCAALDVADGTRDLYVGKTEMNHSFVSKRGRTPEEVQTYDFERILEKHRPTVVKLDVEGAEYEILEGHAPVLPDCVRLLAVEFHFQRKKEYEDRAAAIVLTLLEDFQHVYGPVRTGAWRQNTEVIMERR